MSAITTYLLGDNIVPTITRPYNIITAISGQQSNIDKIVDLEQINAYNNFELQNWQDNDELYRQLMDMLMSLVQDDTTFFCFNIIDNIYLNISLIIKALFQDILNIKCITDIVEKLYSVSEIHDIFFMSADLGGAKYNLLFELIREEINPYLDQEMISASIANNIEYVRYILDRSNARNRENLFFYYNYTLSNLNEHIPPKSTIITSYDDIDYLQRVINSDDFIEKGFTLSAYNCDRKQNISSLLYLILDRIMADLYSTSEISQNDKLRYSILFVWALIQKGAIKLIVPPQIFKRMEQILGSFAEEIKPSAR